jgi:hypothetical protein
MIHHDFEYIATKLGISVEELQGYFDGPNKGYLDYKNQIWTYKIGTRVMQMLGMEKRTMR